MEQRSLQKQELIKCVWFWLRGHLARNSGRKGRGFSPNPMWTHGENVRKWVKAMPWRACMGMGKESFLVIFKGYNGPPKRIFGMEEVTKASCKLKGLDQQGQNGWKHKEDKRIKARRKLKKWSREPPVRRYLEEGWKKGGMGRSRREVCISHLARCRSRC